jgi:hypothetical protein
MEEEKSNIFIAPTIGLIFGNLGGNKDKGGSGLIAPYGIDVALMLGVTLGFLKTVGFTVTPGIAIGKMGFFVISFGIHYKQKVGIGIVIPVFPLWVM